jgi:hypothetical protein
MPFTSAHIAAILPFKKQTPHVFSLSGLVIGSMVPDFEYFVRMTLYGHYGHTFWGIFFFDIPLGVVLYLLFHAFVRRSTILHLPDYFYIRTANAEDFDWKSYFKIHFFKIILSIFIGVLTHFIWDGFTHDEEYYVARFFTFLFIDIEFLGKQIPLHFLLQIISTFVGMGILVWYIHRLPQSQFKQSKPNREIIKFWTWVVILGIIIGIVRWSFGMPNEKIVGQLIVVSVSASLLSWLIISFVYSKKVLKINS